ncbi:MAG: site-specific integrase [Clostridia bacterium]|nr:site-specific integrase [Clostridia bacterium]
MAYYKITQNRKGGLVGRIHISTKDTDTGKNKIIAKRFYNEDNLTPPKFEKYIEKLSIQLEEEAISAYKKKFEPCRNRVLTFEQLSEEFVENLRKNLSISYYSKAKKSIKLFADYLEKIHMDKEPISEIKVRDVQMFLNSFQTYDLEPKGLVILKRDFPETVNLRKMAKDGVLARCTSYNLRHNKKRITTDKAISICKYCNIDFMQYFEKIDTIRQYSVETIKGHRRVLRTVFNEGVRYEWILKNPVAQTRIGSGTGNTSLKPIHEKEVFSFGEAHDFLKTLDKIDYDYFNKKIIFKFMLLTGVRIGEVCGLKWEDIDLEKKIVHVRRNRLYSPEFGVYEKTPKTRTSIRDIPLTDALVEDLKKYYEWFKMADDEFDTKQNEYYFAVNMYREPVGNASVGKWLSSFEKRNGFKHVSCHGLRHTYCSLLLSQNVPIQTVSKYMGHSDSTITLKIYSHFIPDTQEKVLNALNNLG